MMYYNNYPPKLTQYIPDETITTKKIILMFKKQIYKVLLNHVTMIKNSKNLMTFELFRVWNKNQEQGLVEMAQDIVRREHELRATVKKAQHEKRMEKMEAAKHKEDAGRPVIVPEKHGVKSMFTPIIMSKYQYLLFHLTRWMIV